MGDDRKAFGDRCENLAAEYLLARGYQVLQRNYRVRRGEIDLICLDGETFVFVEVKARRSTRFGTGCEAVGHRKQQTLMELAQWYLRDHPPRACRFDVVSVHQGPSGPPQIEHLPNAFP